jgi:hypothetical protein
VSPYSSDVMCVSVWWLRHWICGHNIAVVSANPADAISVLIWASIILQCGADTSALPEATTRRALLYSVLQPIRRRTSEGSCCLQEHALLALEQWSSSDSQIAITLEKLTNIGLLCKIFLFWQVKLRCVVMCFAIKVLNNKACWAGRMFHPRNYRLNFTTRKTKA